MKNKDTETLTTAYPLQWPAGEGRTPAHRKQVARFSTHGRELTITVALQRLRDELRKLKATAIVMSTNIPVRRDGLPYSSVREPSDTGVAIYFRITNTSVVFPCDRWKRVADNLNAVAAHLTAMRAQQRYGVGRQEQAYTGYKALTAADAPKLWYVVLGFESPPVRLASVTEKMHELARKHHPDVGGSAALMAEINVAYAVARLYYNDDAATPPWG